VIDLHSHILPGLDDGAPDLDASVEMAETAAAAGIRTIAATPHISNRYPNEPEAIARAIGQVNVALARRGVALAVLPGAEIATERLSQLSNDALHSLALGGASCLLVETPYSGAAPFLEEALFDLQVRGFQPMLAHPERSLALREKPDRLAEMVSRGVAACVNAGSLAGQFGTRAQKLGFEFLRRGLVHVIASDSHDVSRRPPDLRPGLEALERELPSLAEHVDYFTRTAPEALLAARMPPPPPVPDPPAPAGGWRRLLHR
jgi:protein-tyrosine phosphatase